MPPTYGQKVLPKKDYFTRKIRAYEKEFTNEENRKRLESKVESKKLMFYTKF
jgi:hypothetical protein